LEWVRSHLAREKDMEGFCRVLGRAGAMFWERIEECEEVVRLGLVGSDLELELEIKHDGRG